MKFLENCPFCGRPPTLGNTSPYGDDLPTYFCCGVKIISETCEKWNLYSKAITSYKEKLDETTL